MKIQLKAWVMDEADRQKTTPRAIYMRLHRGKYPHLSLIRVNKRVVWVETDAVNDWMGEGYFTQCR